MSSRAETALVGVYEISKLLAAPHRLESELSGVLTLLSSFLDMHNGLIALLTPDGEAEMLVGPGWSDAKPERFFERLPERAIGQIVVTEMPLVVPNVRADPLFAGVDVTSWAPDDGRPFSMVGVPIKDADRVVGTLTVIRGHDDARLDDDVRFLAMVSNLIGQHLRLHEVIARDRERLLAEQRRLEKVVENRAAPRSSSGGLALRGVVGDSDAVHRVVDKIRIVAKSHSTVLLRGESGTGKELFASALHELSPRRKGPFIRVNCAAIPESVLESELFGHEKGAFTGAVAQRKGRFELADGGTLFLDEIGEISASFQAKLLRVLQEGEFERVGGTRTLKVDVRLVCATNQNLEEAVERGDFRSDLYYRISVVPILLPPLRARKGDVPLLAGEFVQRFNAEHGTSLSLSGSALRVLDECYFPGNIRELENCIRRTATLASGAQIADIDFACRNDVCLSSVLWRGVQKTAVEPARPAPQQPSVVPAYAPAAPAPQEASAASPSPDAISFGSGDARSERERLVEAMRTAGWVQAKAARLLGLTPRQIGYALRKHGVAVEKF
jgi:Nif-specific regulatory protein